MVCSSCRQQGMGWRSQWRARVPILDTMSVPEDAGSEEMAAVLFLLRSIGTHLTAEQIAVNLGLEVPIVDRALQRLLVRRQVVCKSHEPPGSSRVCRPIWSGDAHEQ